MPLKINVPYSEKDLAKSKGAFWDSLLKTWFLPDNLDINNFLPWINHNFVILRKPIFIGVSTSTCYRCHNKITVIALCSNNFYSYEQLHENETYGRGLGEKFIKNQYFSFFHYPKYIDSEALSCINKIFSSSQYQYRYSKTVESKYWVNVCNHCGSIAGDFFLHEEPGGAFCPIDSDDCSKIRLIEIDTKYDVCIEAGYSIASNADDIFDYVSKSFLKIK